MKSSKFYLAVEEHIEHLSSLVRFRFSCLTGCSLVSWWYCLFSPTSIGVPPAQVLISLSISVSPHAPAHGFKHLQILLMLKFISLTRYPVFDLLYLESLTHCWRNISIWDQNELLIFLPQTCSTHIFPNLPMALVSSFISFFFLEPDTPHSKHEQMALLSKCIQNLTASHHSCYYPSSGLLAPLICIIAEAYQLVSMLPLLLTLIVYFNFFFIF